MADNLEIDIEAIVRGRLGKRARWVPGFVFRWLKEFIHEDFINTYLRQGNVGVEFCLKGVEYLGVDVEIQGRENLPPSGGRYIFVSNHPLGGIDGVTLGGVLGREYDGKVVYLVNDFLMNLKGLAPLCVPVNLVGRQSRQSSEQVAEAFRGERHPIMFPAGLCSRRQSDGSIRDLPWSKSFIRMSVKHQRDVVPIHFEGRNSDRFYNVANWCKRLHLPNLAMAMLPDEMYRSCGGHYTLKIGTPIAWQTFDKSKKPDEWAQIVKSKVYEL